jgi:membrane-bound lytic murein transglycosylase F
MTRFPHWLGVSLLALLSACGRPVPPPEQSGELVAVMRNGPATYYLDADDQPAGMEYALLLRFAESQGWSLRIVPAEDEDAARRLLRRGQAHLAAGFADTSPWKFDRTSPVYVRDRAVLVVREGEPSRLAELAGKRVGLALGVSGPRLPKGVKPRRDWPEDLLDALSQGELDAAIVPRQDYRIARATAPELSESGAPGDEATKGKATMGEAAYAWVYPALGQGKLVKTANAYLTRAMRDGAIARLRDSHFGHLRRAESADIAGLIDAMHAQLSGLRAWFQQAQETTGLDWRLIAAIGYQESKWDARAVSPTGVRGFMMLTADTAERMGVADRHDARDSIRAGAAYIATLRDELPPSVAEPDRTYMALAAYNLGMGHLIDARRLARGQGLDPDHWPDVKRVLPQLARASHYRALKHGYARGGEALAFVESTRLYWDVLKKFEPEYRTLFTLPW